MRSTALIIIGIFLALLVIFFLVIKPLVLVKERRPQLPEFPYYVIVDVETDTPLAYISSIPVSVGDELITRENKLYRVVAVEGNTAYARFVKKVDLIPQGRPIDVPTHYEFASIPDSSVYHLCPAQQIEPLCKFQWERPMGISCRPSRMPIYALAILEKALAQPLDLVQLYLARQFQRDRAQECLGPESLTGCYLDAIASNTWR